MGDPASVTWKNLVRARQHDPPGLMKTILGAGSSGYRDVTSQSANPVPQMSNQQSRANGQAIAMSPGYLNHLKSRAEVPP